MVLKKELREGTKERMEGGREGGREGGWKRVLEEGRVQGRELKR